MPLSSILDPVFTEAGNEWNVDPRLLKAMAVTESAGRANAVSNKGAGGLMQIMPATASSLGMTNVNDPVQSIWGGAKYMAEALDAEKTPEDALRYYHGGPGWRGAYGPESQAYAPKVTANYQKLAAADLPVPPVPPATGAQAVPPAAATAVMSDPTDDFLSGKSGTGAPGTAPAAAAGAPAPARDATDDFLSGKGADAAKMDAAKTAKPAEAESAAASTPAETPMTDAEANARDIAGVKRIASAVGQGAVDGFGQPMGQTILSPAAQAWMDAKQRQGGVGGFLAGLGSTAADDIGTAGGVVAGIGNALVRAYQGGVSQLGTEAGVPQLGRDLAALPEAFPTGDFSGGSRVAVPENRLAGGKTADATPTSSEGRAVPTMTIHPDIAPGAREPPSAPGAPGANKLATPPMVANPAAEAVKAPAFVPPGSQIPPSPEPAFVPPGAARPAPETVPPSMIPNRLAGAAEPVRPSEPAAPGPQSGGAAGADVTTSPIPELTPAQKATNLQKMVGQSAEDRLTPQGRDDAVYFPGVERPEAMKDFTPAAEGEMSSALQHKVLYNTDSNYHDQYDAQVKKNNTVMVDGLHDMFGDANTREAAMNDARDLMPGSVHLFDDQKPVDVAPIAAKINEILRGPAGKIDGVSSIMQKMLPKLQDADGNPETLPSQIKGMFDDINNKLYDKSPTTEGNAARQASNQLKDLKSTVSDVIGQGLPGPKWSDYLTNLSGALGHVNKLDYMQQFLTGPKKLTDLAGNLQFNKVQKMLEDIQKRSNDQTGGARQMTMEEINRIEAVRNELAAKDLLDRRASVRGSPTVQLANGAGILGSGPIGTAVKGGATLGTHLLLAKTTGGFGNAALLTHQHIIKPAAQAARAQKAANALVATKNRLLDTAPNRLANPD